MKFLVTLSLLAFALCADAGVSVNNPFYCYSSDFVRPQVELHSVRTSYESVRRTSVNPTVSTCTPSRFWFLSRHGGRLPEVPLLQEMFDLVDSGLQEAIVRNHDAGRTTLCRQDLELLRNWVRNPNMTVQFESMNTVAGWMAMEGIGRRYQQFFPNILQPFYTQQRYLFRHAITQRSQASIRAFVDGLFGFNSWQNVIFEPIPHQDTFLRPIDYCPAYIEYTSTRPHQDAFVEGPEVEEMLEQINRRLGFRGSSQLSFHQVLLLWSWCRFETASTVEPSGNNRGQLSPWCAPFSVAHHTILEYYEDLGYYYFTGYGVRNQSLVSNLNCGLMQDLLRLMQSTNPNDQLVRIFGTDSQMVQLFLVTLGAFRDENHLTQHNFAQQTFRQWKTSLLTPNAANLAVVRYDCPNGDNDLLFLLNERPIHVPGCDAVTGLCRVNFILTRFQRFLNANCNTFFCTG